MPRPHGRRIGCDYCAIYPEMENPASYRRELVAWEHGDRRHVAALYAEGNDFDYLVLNIYNKGKLDMRSPGSMSTTARGAGASFRGTGSTVGHGCRPSIAGRRCWTDDRQAA